MFRSHNFSGEVAFLVLITGLNVAFACWDSRLRLTEMRTRVKFIQQFLQSFLEEWRDKCDWKPENYPHIHSPQSPSITLQPTIRDGQIVNLPWALLVQGDVIILRPGQAAPGRCRSLKVFETFGTLNCAKQLNTTTIQVPNKDGLEFTLEMDEIYAPLVEDCRPSEAFNTPQMRQPLPCVYCLLEETPYVHSVRTVLRDALKRPTSVLHKEKYLCFTVCLEQFAAPVFLLLLLIVNAVRFFYSSAWLSTGYWTDMFLVQPCCVTLPLLPLVLPAAWLLINAYGVALILALFYSARHYKVQGSNDPFEEAEVTSPTHSSFWSKCRLAAPYLLDTLLGRSKSPFRTENLFQTLSSVTALCCVDKKGILSWPNPTAEKVFFLRNESQEQPSGFSPGGSSPSPEQAPKATGAILKKNKQNSRKKSRKRSRQHSKTSEMAQS